MAGEGTATVPPMDTARTALDATALGTLRDRVRREVDDGLSPAVQFAVARDGEVVHLESFGEARDDTRFAVFSCTKAVIGAAVWQLLGEGALELDSPVVELVPAFAAADGVTVRHLLTHTGGFPQAPLGPPRWDTREGRLEQYQRWRLQYPPGERFEYHPTAGHWILAEILEVIDGEGYRDVVRRRVLDPLGLDGFLLGGSEAADAKVAELVMVGELPTAEELEEVLGIPGIDLGELLGEVTPELLLHFNAPAAREVGIPGGGGVTDAASLALLYQAFLHNPGDMWDPRWLAAGTAEVYSDLPDPMMGFPAHRTLGLIMAGDDGRSAMRGMGHTVSARTFGHNGAGGQIAWADPESGLSFAFCTAGLDQNFLRERRRTSSIASKAGLLSPTP